MPYTRIIRVFAMRDRPLIIKDIICRTWHWQFLSVSQTTVDDEKSPNEFIHLAVAMQFSGFRSMISSMRSFDDKVARLLCLLLPQPGPCSGRLGCHNASVIALCTNAACYSLVDHDHAFGIRCSSDETDTLTFHLITHDQWYK